MHTHKYSLVVGTGKEFTELPYINLGPSIAFSAWQWLFGVPDRTISHHQLLPDSFSLEKPENEAGEHSAYNMLSLGTQKWE